MYSQPLALAALLALAACAPEPVTTMSVAAPPTPSATDEQVAALPSAGLAGPARMMRGDVAVPPPLPGAKRASLPAAEAPPPVDRIVVHKMDRRMELQRAGEVVRTYTIDIGWQTLGHKQHAGDGRTPEGIYEIEGRNPRSAFHRSLKISYPNADDTAKARARGLSPGGLIMIHGQPNDPRSYARAQSKKDWTEGCIAVSNAEVEEIWAMVVDGTTIDLRP